MPGTTEILIIGGIIVLLFGAAAIPKLARSIGQAKREFESGIKDAKNGKIEEEPNAGQNGPADPPAQG